jgi:hypothetical protein
MTRSFARTVDLLLQFLLWVIIPLDLMPHIIDSPFTRWLRDVHIFWWLLGTFVAWLSWKQLFCGGLPRSKTLGSKKGSDTVQN